MTSTAWVTRSAACGRKAISSSLVSNLATFIKKVTSTRSAWGKAVRIFIKVLWEINLSEHCAILANSVMPMRTRSMWHLCRYPMIAVPKDKKHGRVFVALLQRCSIREAMEPRGGELSILALKKDATKQAFLPIRIAGACSPLNAAAYLLLDEVMSGR